MKTKLEIEGKLKELVEKSLKTMLLEEDLKQYISIEGDMINIDLRLNIKFPNQLYLNTYFTK